MAVVNFIFFWFVFIVLWGCDNLTFSNFIHYLNASMYMLEYSFNASDPFQEKFLALPSNFLHKKKNPLKVRGHTVGDFICSRKFSFRQKEGYPSSRLGSYLRYGLIQIWPIFPPSSFSSSNINNVLKCDVWNPANLWKFKHSFNGHLWFQVLHVLRDVIRMGV